MRRLLLSLLLGVVSALNTNADGVVNLVSSNTFGLFTNYATTNLNTKLYTNYTTANILSFGAIPDDSSSDDLALTNALAQVSQIIFPEGTYNFNTNIIIGSGKTLRLEAGAILKPASGVIIGISGLFDAPMQNCIDTTAGGRIIFKQSAAGVATTRTPAIPSLWWVGVTDNGSTDCTTGLRAWAGCLEASLSTPLWLMGSGNYVITGGLTFSNRNQMLGIGRPALLFTGTNGEAAINIAPNSSDVKLKNFLVTKATSDTNETVGINFGDGCDRLTVTDVQLSGLRKAGIYVNGSSGVGSLYARFENVHIISGVNTNTGSLPAAAVWITNGLSASLFKDCTINGYDTAYRIYGAVGSSTNTGMISVVGGGIEGCGLNGVYATNIIEGIAVTKLNFDKVHIEHNKCLNLFSLSASRQFEIRDCVIAGDFNGTVYSTNLFYFNGIHSGALLGGNSLNNCVSNYIFNASSTIPIAINGNNYFDLGGINPTATTNILSRISGLTTWDGWYIGTGSPSNVITAPIGSTYRRLDGGANTSIYVNETGVNTGWTPK